VGEQGTLERELFSDGDIVVLATSDYTETDSECVIVGPINSADEEELTRIAMETEEEREVLSDETLFEPGLTEDNTMEAVEWSSLGEEEDCPANRPNIEVVDLTGSGGEEEEGVAVADNAQQQRWYPPVCPPDAPCGDSCYCYCLNCREHQPYSGGQCKCVLRRGPISWSDEEGSYSSDAEESRSSDGEESRSSDGEESRCSNSSGDDNSNSSDAADNCDGWVPPVCGPDDACKTGNNSCFGWCIGCHAHHPYSGRQCDCSGPVHWVDNYNSGSDASEDSFSAFLG
jgi:hypothetical protein